MLSTDSEELLGQLVLLISLLYAIVIVMWCCMAGYGSSNSDDVYRLKEEQKVHARSLYELHEKQKKHEKMLQDIY